MTTSISGSSHIPVILRLFYVILKVPARCLLWITPQGVQRRWFGSDVFERYTSHYTWITNQLGHFSVGAFFYLLASIPALWVADNTTATCPAANGGTALNLLAGFALLLWLIYVVKEVADIEREHPKDKRRFRLNIREVAIDGWTDSFFVLAGIAFTHSVVWIMSNAVCDKIFDTSWDYFYTVVVVVCGGYAILCGCLFLPQKNRFDASFLPFYFRLTCFYNDLNGALWQPGARSGDSFQDERRLVAEIERVASGAEASPHVCIFGPSGSGKTSLAVAIACELIAGRGKVRYLSANGITAVRDTGSKEAARDTLQAGLLPPDEAEWIVIDYVSPDNADVVITEATRLASLARRPVFILACDHGGNDRDEFVRRLSSALDAPCLAIRLDGVMPRFGSRATEAISAAPRALSHAQSEAAFSSSAM
jgi:hypothetical protein